MNKRSSIRFMITISFIIIMLTILSTIGYIVFSNWLKSTDIIITKFENDASSYILEKIDTFMSVPLYINESNYKLIEKGIVDINNNMERETYFAGVVNSNNSEVYSFTFGTENGEYYGARRNEKNEIEIVKNNSSTGGKSYYYSITKDLTADKLVLETDKFDARTRDWYKIAKEKHQPVFSPVYKHFVMNDLAISAAYPIYNNDGTLKGVLGTHIILSKINNYLKEPVKGKHAVAYIIEKNSGGVIANSLGITNFETLPDDQIKRISIDNIENKQIIEAFHNFKKSRTDNSIITTKNDRLHLKTTEYVKEGLDWLIITSIPESPFTDDITRSIHISILLSILVLVIAMMIYFKSTGIVLKPVYNLINTTEKFTKGDFQQRATIYKNDEIGLLAKAFNVMADEISTLINTLDEKVKERTNELVKTNLELKEAKEMAEKLATHDYLTGLPNRVLFMDRIETAISAADRKNSSFSVMSIDLDKFKDINDKYGHNAGDCFLKEITVRLKELLRESDSLARMGGDEFILLSSEINTPEEAEIIAARILGAVGREFECIDINIIKPTLSIGIAFYPRDGKNSEEMIVNSDVALYRAKNNGRNRFEFYGG